MMMQAYESEGSSPRLSPGGVTRDIVAEVAAAVGEPAGVQARLERMRPPPVQQAVPHPSLMTRVVDDVSSRGHSRQRQRIDRNDRFDRIEPLEEDQWRVSRPTVSPPRSPVGETLAELGGMSGMGPVGGRVPLGELVDHANRLASYSAVGMPLGGGDPHAALQVQQLRQQMLISKQHVISDQQWQHQRRLEHIIKKQQCQIKSLERKQRQMVDVLDCIQSTQMNVKMLA